MLQNSFWKRPPANIVVDQCIMLLIAGYCCKTMDSFDQTDGFVLGEFNRNTRKLIDLLCSGA